MKTSAAKIILIVALLLGANSALLLYNRVLFFLSKVFPYIYNWLSFTLLFVVIWFIAKAGIKQLAGDLITTNNVNELTLFKISKFYFGGLAGFYVLISLGSIIVFSVYSLFKIILT